MVVGLLWQGSRHPGLHRVVLAKTTERFHQLGKTRPPEAGKAPILEPADHRLMDAAEHLELPLRYPGVAASTEHRPADQGEPASRSCVGTFEAERLPGHGFTMADRAYLAIAGMPSDRSHAPVMQMGCITNASATLWRRPRAATAGPIDGRPDYGQPRNARPPDTRRHHAGSDMHPICIVRAGSLPPGLVERATGAG